MIEVEIRNYQSIAYTKLQIEGFTTLIGRNYLGKSAVLRAINAALTNQQGTKFIRWGQTFCEVRLKFPDLDILWHKEEGNNFYEITNASGKKRYDKIGKDEPPKEILEAGYKPVFLGDQKINLNYAVQFFPLFLVDTQDSRGADLLTSVYGLDRIYKAIDLCNKEQRANSDLLRIREKDLAQISSSLERFKDFTGVVSLIPDIKDKRKAFEAKEAEIERVKVWKDSVINLFTYCKKMKPIIELTVPKPGEISTGLSEYNKLMVYKKNIDELMTVLKRTKPVLSITLPDQSVPRIREQFSEYQQLLKWRSNYRVLSEEVSRLSKISEVVIPEHSINMEDVPKLQKIQEQLSTANNNFKIAKKSLDDTITEIATVEKELGEFDLCPLCGAKR
jgi:hypothetical protein